MNKCHFNQPNNGQTDEQFTKNAHETVQTISILSSLRLLSVAIIVFIFAWHTGYMALHSPFASYCSNDKTTLHGLYNNDNKHANKNI